MRVLSRFWGYLWSYFFSPWINEKCKAIKAHLYTGYYAHQFKKFGRLSIIRSFSHTRGLKYVQVGERVSIGSHVELTAWDNYKGQKFKPEIIIGDGTSIRDYSQITAINSIRIGSGVLTGPNILITDNAHGASLAELLDIAPNLRPLSISVPLKWDELNN